MLSTFCSSGKPSSTFKKFGKPAHYVLRTSVRDEVSNAFGRKEKVRENIN